VNKLLLLLLLAINLYADDTLRFTFVGDIMLTRGVKDFITKSKFINIYKKYFDSSSINIANLETAVSNQKSIIIKKYNFNSSKESLNYLKEIGFTHLSLANNHTIDYGSCGLEETVENIRSKSLVPFGYINKSNNQFYTEISDNLNRVAVLAAVLLKLPYYSTDTCKDIKIYNPNFQELINEIKKFKLKNPDKYLILFLHWGVENKNKIDSWQRSQATELLKEGADMIVGSHPHVIQDYELIDSKPVYYSLGNFIFDTKDKCGLLRLSFVKSKLVNHSLQTIPPLYELMK
jgi:poly-gamma-glutamate synthesis protein (capsule biosynthesis protein)